MTTKEATKGMLKAGEFNSAYQMAKFASAPSAWDTQEQRLERLKFSHIAKYIAMGEFAIALDECAEQNA